MRQCPSAGFWLKNSAPATTDARRRTLRVSACTRPDVTTMLLNGSWPVICEGTSDREELKSWPRAEPHCALMPRSPGVRSRGSAWPRDSVSNHFRSRNVLSCSTNSLFRHASSGWFVKSRPAHDSHGEICKNVIISTSAHRVRETKTCPSPRLCFGGKDLVMTTRKTCRSLWMMGANFRTASLPPHFVTFVANVDSLAPVDSPCSPWRAASGSLSLFARLCRPPGGP